LLMTGPGWRCFTAVWCVGKTCLATMMQSFILMAVVSVVWALFGYSLAFAKGNAIIGGLSYLFLKAWARILPSMRRRFRR
jgi:Amt family ammonium transporter